MALQFYELDRIAQELVLDFRDQEEVLNESHKMRATVAYGLERFWGEHIRLKGKEKTEQKGEYWAKTWTAFVDLMKQGGITLPAEVNLTKTSDIQKVTRQFWDNESLSMGDRRIAISVLTQLCETLVWWTQRYKK